MALQSCRECGRPVSTEAPACPHCGAPRPTAPADSPLSPLQGQQHAHAPERRPQGSEDGHNNRKWRPDEHRRPVGLTSVSAHVRRNACKMLARALRILS